jgi:hypothetical protein
MSRRLIVTHHAPDLDACGAVWLLKKFDSQHYADAKVAFVNPGATISDEALKELDFKPSEITHVDTGLGEFDHHQPDRGLQHISASSLVYDYVCQVHPDLEHDQALKKLVEFITEVDHFGEVHWPDASSLRNSLMIHELIRGMEFTDPHNDDSQMYFGLQCLTNAYASLTQINKAEEIIAQEGQPFTLPIGRCLALETRNDDTIKVAQKQGYMLVVRKDPEQGNIRIKARPDAEMDLKALADQVTQLDPKATWYYHPSGKMLINGSRKHRNQQASQLTLQQILELIIKTYDQ